MHHYQHHIGDYEAATAHLDWDEDMAYTRFMRIYYRDERPIPTDLDEACRLIRAKSLREKNAARAVLREFFSLTENGWINKRCETEIEKYRDKSTKSKSAALLSVKVRAKKLSDFHQRALSERSQDVEPTANRQPPTVNRKPPTAPLTPEAAEIGGGGDEVQKGDEDQIANRLGQLGIRSARKVAGESLHFRPFQTVMATIEFYENTYHLPDGTCAFLQGPGYLVWRLTSPECRETIPTKGWREIDNPEFTFGRKRQTDESRRAKEQESVRKSSEPVESVIEKQFGPAVDALEWDEALPLITISTIRRLANESRALNERPGTRHSVRTVLLSALAAKAKSPTLEQPIHG